LAVGDVRKAIGTTLLGHQRGQRNVDRKKIMQGSLQLLVGQPSGLDATEASLPVTLDIGDPSPGCGQELISLFCGHLVGVLRRHLVIRNAIENANPMIHRLWVGQTFQRNQIQPAFGPRSLMAINTVPAQKLLRRLRQISGNGLDADKGISNQPKQTNRHGISENGEGGNALNSGECASPIRRDPHFRLQPTFGRGSLPASFVISTDRH
jgi:hypothetical protein